MEEKNLIQNWIDTDKKLFDLLVDIQNIEQNDRKQAELAFHRIPKLYELPKYPEDNEKDLFCLSVYEQLAILNFLEPKGDIRGHVLSSIFYIKENYLVDLGLVYHKRFGSEEPPKDFIGIGYKGDTIDVLPVFVMKSQTWIDLGCKYFTKEIDFV